MARYKNVNGERIPLTSEEETQRDIEEQEFIDNAVQRKLNFVRELRNERLAQTDWYSNSDVTMPDNIKTWRQNLRNLPQDYDTEVKLDELLKKETDKTKTNYRKLTHTIWEKP